VVGRVYEPTLVVSISAYVSPGRKVIGSRNPTTPTGSSSPDPEFPERKNPPHLPSRTAHSPPSAVVVVAVVAAVASRSHPSAVMRTQVVSTLIRARPSTVSRVTPRLVRLSSNGHHQETFEAFTDRYVNFFQTAEDLFEVQRGLNNCFAHDLVPAPAVVESALRASRRVNDYATAVRIFEGVKEKVENRTQYQAYLEELKPVREELGMSTLSSRFSRFSFTFLFSAFVRHRNKRRLVLFADCIDCQLFK
jgi:cytochrome c oxidase subunit 5a